MGVVSFFGAEIAHHLQGLFQRLSAFQRALACKLNGGAVCHRVGERHTQFNDVHARARQAAHDIKRGRGIGGPPP